MTATAWSATPLYDDLVASLGDPSREAYTARLVREEAEHAEAHRDEALPATVVATRPNRRAARRRR